MLVSILWTPLHSSYIMTDENAIVHRRACSFSFIDSLICVSVCSEDRIRNGCKKILKSRQGSTQGRLDSFFTVTGSLSSKRKVHMCFQSNWMIGTVSESWSRLFVFSTWKIVFLTISIVHVQFSSVMFFWMLDSWAVFFILFFLSYLGGWN